MMVERERICGSRFCENALKIAKSYESYKVIALGVLSTLGALAVANQYNIVRVAQNTSNPFEESIFEDTTEQSYQVFSGWNWVHIGPYGANRRVVELGLSALGLGIVHLSYFINSPHKVIKIALPLIISTGIGISAGLQFPEECTRAKTNFIYNPGYLTGCREKYFNASEIGSYFSGCTVLPWEFVAGGLNLPQPGGFCNNISIEKTLWGKWNQWVYDERYPTSVVDGTPGCCGLLTASSSNISFNIVMGSGFDNISSYYWLNENDNFLSPMDIRCTPTVLQNYSDGSWEGSIECRGWIMEFEQSDFCYVPFERLPEQVRGCTTEYFQETIEHYQKSLELNEQFLSRFTNTKKCPDKIQSLLNANDALMSLVGLVGIIYAGCFAILCGYQLMIYLDKKEMLREEGGRVEEGEGGGIELQLIGTNNQ